MGEKAAASRCSATAPSNRAAVALTLSQPHAIPKALQQVADDLAAQYVITYALPAGVKPDRRFAITTDRKGLSLRAPVGAARSMSKFSPRPPLSLWLSSY